MLPSVKCEVSVKHTHHQEWKMLIEFSPRATSGSQGQGHQSRKTSLVSFQFAFYCLHDPWLKKNIHYDDVMMGTVRLKSPASPLFTQPLIQVQIKENNTAPRHWPLCGEFTGDRWMPRTNGQ